MKKELLKEVMLDQRDFFLTPKSLIERDINLDVYIKSRQIVIISGIRRCGKSSLLYLIKERLKKKEEDIACFNFDDERLISFTAEDFNVIYALHLELFKSKDETGIVFFFDEIQNVRGWERFLTRMYERGIKIFVTGSNASLLSSEIASSLTGRNLIIRLYPFSFNEYLKISNLKHNVTELTTAGKAGIISEFNDYCKFGGFPIAAMEKNAEIIKSYYQDILYRDIITRYKINRVEQIKQIGLYLMSSCAKSFSYKTLLNISGLKSLSSVKNYLDYFEAAYLFYYVKKFDYSIKKQILNPRKVYAADISLCLQIGFKFTEDTGHILENIVFLELKRRENEIFYHNDGYECDFVIKEGLKIKHAIQVTKNLLDEKTRIREFRGLVSALKKYSLPEGLLLTGDTESEEYFEGYRIIILPVWKWLLQKLKDDEY